jgi:hypothetical protein
MAVLLRTQAEAIMVLDDVMLDDVYGSDQDRFPLEQDSELWAAECPELEWEETEIQTLARSLSGRERLPTE